MATQVASIGVNDKGAAVHIPLLADSAAGTTVRLFMRADGSGALLSTDQEGRLNWSVIYADGTRIPMPTDAVITRFQSPWTQGPLCKGVFAAADGLLLKVFTFGSALQVHTVDLQQLFPPEHGGLWTIGDIAVTPAAIAVRVLHDPRPGLTCVYALCCRAGTVLRTPSATMGRREPMHALSRDGRYLLTCDRPSKGAVCYQLPRDAHCVEATECWHLSASIGHCVPCGDSDFAVRLAGEVRAVAGADGRTLHTVWDYDLFGSLFALSESGNMMVHENLTIVPFIQNTKK